MGEIQIQKIQRTVQVKDANNTRKKVQKTYGKIIYRKTLTLDDMAEHIMKHGSVYTEDVVHPDQRRCRQRQGLQRHGERHPHRHRLPGRPEPQVYVQGTLYA